MGKRNPLFNNGKNFKGKNKVNIIDFVLKARKLGYPGGGENKEIVFEDNSRGFEVISDGYRYFDRYFGFNPFSGFEKIFDVKGNLLWVMNYFGEMCGQTPAPGDIYAFLRQALMSAGRDYPFRGPKEFVNGGFRYENNQTGSFNRFRGEEYIYQYDEKIYFLYYHGGRMNPF